MESHLNWRHWSSKTKTACLAGIGLTREASSAGTQSEQSQLNPMLRLCCLWFMSFGRTSMAKKLSGSSRPEKLKSMSSEDIKSRKWTDSEKESLRRLATEQSSGEAISAGSADIPPLSAEQLERLTSFRRVRGKVAVSVRLDPRVVEWLKSKGNGHLTRINDILTNLMEAEQRRSSR